MVRSAWCSTAARTAVPGIIQDSSIVSTRGTLQLPLTVTDQCFDAMQVASFNFLSPRKGKSSRLLHHDTATGRSCIQQCSHHMRKSPSRFTSRLLSTAPAPAPLPSRCTVCPPHLKRKLRRRRPATSSAPAVTWRLPREDLQHHVRGHVLQDEVDASLTVVWRFACGLLELVPYGWRNNIFWDFESFLDWPGGALLAATTVGLLYSAAWLCGTLFTHPWYCACALPSHRSLYRIIMADSARKNRRQLLELNEGQ